MAGEERIHHVAEMLKYIDDNNIFYICDLWHYAETERSIDWFPILQQRKTYYCMKTILKEKRERQRRKRLKVPSPQHGFWEDDAATI